MKKKKVKPVIPQAEEVKVKSFFDMVAPSVVKFFPDHFICGNTYRCVWALREYPTSTDEQAILRHLGEKNGVTLRIYTRQVSPTEEKRIIHNATNKNKMDRSNTNDLQQVVTAESNLQDVTNLIATMHRNREPLLHCAVFIELAASDFEALKLLQTDVLTELVRSKLNVDKLWLRQQQGFVSSNPAGHNAFGQQFERVLPASSVANLYPFNYSGKTDPRGFYIGKDKYGSNVMVDFDQRDEDKTSANILILGNSGQGKSYLMKLLILNFLEAGKSVITLDVEHEQREMCDAVEGCFVDLMAGIYHINVLEPKCWDDGSETDDVGAPEPFRKSTRLAQHVSFLKDFFRAYKDFNDGHIDTIEIMVSKLYTKWGISDNSNFSRKRPEEYCGDCILQKTVTVDCISKTRKVNQGEAPMYIVENNHPAIIPREIFNKVQEEIYRRQVVKPKSSKNTFTSSGKYSKYALTQVLKCGECGTAYRRVVWTSHDKRRVVWRCISRLDHGTKYCPDSLTIPEPALHEAIVRALNRFNEENEATYMALMKATIGEALGLNGDSDEIDLLLRRIDALNKRMLTLVNEAIQTGADVESNEDEFKDISTQIEQLNKRIDAIRKSQSQDNSYEQRLAIIQKTIDQRKKNNQTYDDSIVSQMVECIKVYRDGKLSIIFGGGYEVEEHI